jgi:hypothetical protein
MSETTMWIDCKKELPKIGVEVAVRGSGLSLDFAKLNEDGCFSPCFLRAGVLKHITHWAEKKRACLFFYPLFFGDSSVIDHLAAKRELETKKQEEMK